MHEHEALGGLRRIEHAEVVRVVPEVGAREAEIQPWRAAQQELQGLVEGLGPADQSLAQRVHKRRRVLDGAVDLDDRQAAGMTVSELRQRLEPRRVEEDLERHAACLQGGLDQLVEVGRDDRRQPAADRELGKPRMDRAVRPCLEALPHPEVVGPDLLFHELGLEVGREEARLVTALAEQLEHLGGRLLVARVLAEPLAQGLEQ